ncbi:MAG: dihydroorotate dehydrogenase [Lachnospiraceae bacterium]|nr:dihydroorotate dehydrogenase [Lachnospiraceae bacterium]
MKTLNTSISFCGVDFKNPIITASGTFGSGQEYAEFFDISQLGGITTKGVSLEPWEGNDTPRVAETPSGMLNAIGLQNPGAKVFIERDLAFLENIKTNVIVNLCGHTLEEYIGIAERINETFVPLMELNVSCPNVKAGGIAFGTDPRKLEETVREVKKHVTKPLIVKLSPNVTSISEMAKAAEVGGAEAISLINTFTAMKIDVRKRKFLLANKTGGLSGPAIHPIAVRMVYEAAHAVSLPIIGMGGVASGEDAVEMLMAGAKLVAVGMMNFHELGAALRIKEELESFMREEGIEDIREIESLP